MCIKPNVYELINGFSNEFWNWGGEDDGKFLYKKIPFKTQTIKIYYKFEDLAIRLIKKDICVTRPKSNHAMYKMSYHSSSKRNPVRENLLFNSAHRQTYDGLSSLLYLNVSIVNVQNFPLYTNIKINVGTRDPNYLNKNGYSFFFNFYV